ncbi:MAG: HEPN domain-containing protein [Acidimicrobiales bacterium]
MPELPDNNHDEARRWLGNVEDDLASMRAVQRDSDSPRRMVCFLAHLVVEKALKATLIDAEFPFAKTHNLLELYDTCRSAGRLPNVDSEALKQLNPWTIDGRYADDLVQADRGIADHLAGFAAQLVASVRSELETDRGDE